MSNYRESSRWAACRQKVGRVLVLGSLNADLVVRAARLPGPGETLAGGDLQTHPGGKGANQALAAARLGAPTALVGAVGDDSFADLLLDSQRAAGVDCTAVARVAGPTGVALITVLPDGQNAILISSGANAAVTPEQAEAACGALVPGDLLLCQLETPLSAVAAALAMARARGAQTVLDPAPAQELSGELLRLVDVLTPNETEAAALTGLSAETDTAVIADALLERGPGLIILKKGDRGSYTASREQRFATPARQVVAVDATGAGDVFNAGFAAALSRRETIEQAVEFATAAAAISVTRHGAQPSAPSLAEVRDLLAKPSTASQPHAR